MTDEEWTRRDGWLGGLFVFAGVLITAFAVLTLDRGLPVVFWGAALLLGPVFVLIGGNAVVSAVRAGRRPKDG